MVRFAVWSAEPWWACRGPSGRRPEVFSRSVSIDASLILRATSGGGRGVGGRRRRAGAPVPVRSGGGLRADVLGVLLGGVLDLLHVLLAGLLDGLLRAVGRLLGDLLAVLQGLLARVHGALLDVVGDLADLL